ncbi:DUF975 family protein [Eubacteriales bacterium OttesenSCG-928-K08]|nr:DUF975 family protein [Eubacteriales bacterium OttesenSCG-928-K08]
MNSSDFRAAARRSLSGYWGVALAICLVAGLLGGLDGGGVNFSSNMDIQTLQDMQYYMPGLYSFYTRFMSVMFVLSIVYLFIGGATELGVCTVFSRLNLGERPEFKDLFSRFSIFGKALGLRLFMNLFIMLWSLLLIIPGIVASYRYALAPYIMAEYPDIGIREAVNRSKELMQGHKGDLFAMNLSFIGWSFLCLFTLGIGYLWLNPYMQAANAAFYLNRTGRPCGLAFGEQPPPAADSQESQAYSNNPESI